MPGFLSDDPDFPCTVVVNDDGHHSLWPHDRALPSGWNDAGFSGTRRACLEQIERMTQPAPTK